MRKTINKMAILFCMIFVLSACATNKLYEKPVLGGNDQHQEKVELYIIPLAGFPQDYALRLAKDLSKELELSTKVSVHMGISENMFSPRQQQFIASAIESEAREILPRLVSEKPLYTVVLTHHDLNNYPFNLRFQFAHHNKKDFSVVSIARMDPRVYGQAFDAELVYSRMKKLVKKGIGFGYYGYSLLTDRDSVMYSPIMSLNDLDQIGTDY